MIQTEFHKWLYLKINISDIQLIPIDHLTYDDVNVEM